MPTHPTCVFDCTHAVICRKYFNEGIQALVETVVHSTVELYNNIRAELLPTPSNSHYTFNLRDLAKVTLHNLLQSLPI